MKPKPKLAFLVLLLSALAALGQLQNPITTQQISLPSINAPAQVPSANVQLIGQPGSATYYYWIVSNYALGNSSPAGPFPANNGPGAITSGNGFAITWQPANGALSYDVLITTTPNSPSGFCSLCAVVTGTANNSVIDDGSTYGSYTVNSLDPNAFTHTLTVEPTGSGAAHLILRQNGVQVLDLDTASGSGGGSGGPFTNQVQFQYAAGPSFTVANNSLVPGLTAEFIGAAGVNLHSPGAIGDVTPATSISATTGSFGALSVTGVGTNSVPNLTITSIADKQVLFSVANVLTGSPSLTFDASKPGLGVGALSTPGLQDTIIANANYPGVANPAAGSSLVDISGVLANQPDLAIADPGNVGLAIGVAANPNTDATWGYSGMTVQLATAGANNHSYTGSRLVGALIETDHVGGGNADALIGVYANSFNDGAGAVTDNAGLWVTVQNFGAGTVTNNYGINLNTGQGTITNDWGVLMNAPSGTITNAYAFYAKDYAGAATNPYYEWFDSRGVRRVKEDSTFNSVGQAIEALYNPQFTKYTPGAADYERIILGQWSSNVAQIGPEKGGTGTLRGLELLGASLKLDAVHSTTGTRFLCVGTDGTVSASASACSGT